MIHSIFKESLKKSPCTQGRRVPILYSLSNLWLFLDGLSIIVSAGGHGLDGPVWQMEPETKNKPVNS